ncbi:MJ0042-type zinc finger domain-containing protein [Haladaptatus sp. CMSO5]|uniref:MJ0042-type zinc finger domain-containing protein n=1 Tax=Haladaptatus sp. CMSO5 TaxID=3120514 RepID=UPI002FCDE683
MIKLHPVPEFDLNCPECDVALLVKDWYIPGMRMLAEVKCPQCGRKFYGDLPVGHGLVYPALVDIESGEVYNEFGGDWFANWLETCYSEQKHESIQIEKTKNKTINRPIVLNCLDGLYGHSLLKLLNAQYYLDSTPEYDLFVIVPSNLKWLVPDGVAMVWSIEISLPRGKEWNDWLAKEIKSFLTEFDEAWASMAFSHPHPDDYNISRFTGVEPFALNSWPETTPTVTYIWRDDRLWAPTRSSVQFLRRARGTAYRLGEKLGQNLAIYEQRHNVETLATELKSAFPEINFAVAGIGEPGGLSDSITDLRTPSPNANAERELCRQYSNSHVVVGVHGSNMLLPSAHAGSVVELVPPDRWGNMMQDLLFENEFDYRQSVFVNRHIPTSTPPERVASIVESLIKDRLRHSLHMERKWNHHGIVNYSDLRFEWSDRG